MTVEFKLVQDECFDDVYMLFNNKDFFYKTKRPESLNEFQVRELVFNDASKTYFVLINDNIKGLFSMEEDFVEPNSKILFFRLKNIEMALDYKDELLTCIKELIQDCDIVKCYVFDFDEDGKKVCQYFSFHTEATLKNHVFKYGEYHKLRIFSKKLNSQVNDYDD